MLSKITLPLDEIAGILGSKSTGQEIFIKGVSTPEEQLPGTISVLGKQGMEAEVNGFASAYVVPEDFPETGTEKPLIKVSNTRLALVKLIHIFFPQDNPEPVISPKAAIDAGALICDSVSVGDFAVIAQGVSIGSGSRINSGVNIGKNVTMGSNCIIYSNVTIYAGCVIGNNVIIHAGAVIGGDGFGFVPGVKHTKIPHIGNVVLENDVEIGCNTCIDRATIGSTVIGEGAKIDNLVQIGHNVKVGKGCFISSQSGIGGSTVVGDYSVMGGQVGLADHISICSQVMIAAKSGVSKSINEKGMYGGIPAVPIKDWARRVASAGQVADMRKRLVALEKKIKNEE